VNNDVNNRSKVAFTAEPKCVVAIRQEPSTGQLNRTHDTVPQVKEVVRQIDNAQEPAVSYAEDLSFVAHPDKPSACLILGMTLNFMALPCDLQKQILCDLPTR